MPASSQMASGQFSKKSGQPSKKFGQLSGKAGQLSPACTARAIAFLRARHPAKTAEEVAALTGLPADTVRKWLDRASAPSFAACFALIGAYGPDFVAAVMEHPPAWIDTAARAARREALARDIARLQAELNKLGDAA